MAELRVLGVDPGTRVTGWAVVEAARGSRPQRVASGILELGGSRCPISARLLTLRCALLELLKDWDPELVALESAFFGKNARSALRLGEARGTVMVTVAETGAELLELPPAQVKRRVAGAGRATKEQIARLVKLQLGLSRPLASYDEADALAVALCAVLERESPAAVAGSPPAGSALARPRRTA